MSSTTQVTSDRNNYPVQLDLDRIRDSACSHLRSIDVLVDLLRDGPLLREHKLFGGSACAADRLSGRTVSHRNRRATFSFTLRQNDIGSRKEASPGERPPSLCG